MFGSKAKNKAAWVWGYNKGSAYKWVKVTEPIYKALVHWLPDLNPLARILSEQLSPPSFWQELRRSQPSGQIHEQLLYKAHVSTSLLPCTSLTKQNLSLKSCALGDVVAAERAVGPSDPCRTRPGSLTQSVRCSRAQTPHLALLHPIAGTSRAASRAPQPPSLSMREYAREIWPAPRVICQPAGAGTPGTKQGCGSTAVSVCVCLSVSVCVCAPYQATAERCWRCSCHLRDKSGQMRAWPWPDVGDANVSGMTSCTENKSLQHQKFDVIQSRDFKGHRGKHLRYGSARVLYTHSVVSLPGTCLFSRTHLELNKAQRDTFLLWQVYKWAWWIKVRKDTEVKWHPKVTLKVTPSLWPTLLCSPLFSPLMLWNLTLKIKLLLHLISLINPSFTELFVRCSFWDDISPMSGIFIWHTACRSSSNLTFYLLWGSRRTVRGRKVWFKSFWKENQHYFNFFFFFFKFIQNLLLFQRFTADI